MEFQPRSGIDTVIDSVALIQLYCIFLHPQMFQPCSGSPCPPPVPWSYCSPIFNPSTMLHNLFACTSIPPTRTGAERSSTWKVPPLTGLHRLSTLPSLARRLQGVLHASLWPPSLVWLPLILRPEPAPRSLSNPWVLPSKCTSLPLPTQSHKE